MASENILVLLSMVFKKLGLIANEFLSGICQFLNVGIINFSLEFSKEPKSISEILILFKHSRSQELDNRGGKSLVLLPVLVFENVQQSAKQ